MITKALIMVVALFIIPELLGLLILRFWKDQKNNIILAFVLGYIVEFAIAQLISVPFIFKGQSLTELVNLYVTTIGVLSVLSFLINIWRIVEIIKELIKNIKKMPILLTMLLIILIGAQLFTLFKYGHIDDDDAFYVATATTAVQTDTLFKYSAMTGAETESEQLLMRYRLGPFPLYYAIMSKNLDIHPAIVAHSILPLIFVPIVYMIYWLFANEFFKENKKDAVLFMIFICFLHIFSYYSGKNNFIFVLLRIWQGKAVLSNIILPLILLLFIYGEKNNLNFAAVIAIILTAIAGNFTTTMAIAMVPVCLMLLATIFEIIKLITRQTKITKSFFVMLKSLICSMPALIYGIVYFQDYLK